MRLSPAYAAEIFRQTLKNHLERGDNSLCSFEEQLVADTAPVAAFRMQEIIPDTALDPDSNSYFKGNAPPPHIKSAFDNVRGVMFSHMMGISGVSTESPVLFQDTMKAASPLANILTSHVWRRAVGILAERRAASPTQQKLTLVA